MLYDNIILCSIFMIYNKYAYKYKLGQQVCLGLGPRLNACGYQKIKMWDLYKFR